MADRWKYFSESGGRLSPHHSRGVGHNNPANEKALVQTMGSREDLSRELVDKILIHNPRQF
jgi:hypothetical protein